MLQIVPPVRFVGRWIEYALRENLENKPFRADGRGDQGSRHINTVIEAKNAMETTTILPTTKQDISKVVALTKECHAPV